MVVNCLRGAAVFGSLLASWNKSIQRFDSCFFFTMQDRYILLGFATQCILTTAAKPSLVHCSAF